MTSDVTQNPSSTPKKPNPSKASPSRPKWFTVPEPVKRAFNRFPLQTYPANQLPRRSPSQRSTNTLHIFASEWAARNGKASHNPACLKWQAYLKFADVDFVTVPSNNHASPTGSLPFVLPAISSTSRPITPVSSSKISKWAASQTGLEEEDSGIRYEAYTSLLDHRIRSAWLYHLYLDARNFKSVAWPLYISSASSNSFVQAVLGYQLQNAAREELAKYTNVIDGSELLVAADNALEALSTLLGDDMHFFALSNPGLFDATVFSYTHLLVSGEIQWQNTAMADSLNKYQNLLQHQQRLQVKYFPE